MVAGLMEPQISRRLLLLGYEVARHGHDGAQYIRSDRKRTLIWSIREQDDGQWWHVSISSQPERAGYPDWSEMERIKLAVLGEDVYAYVVIPPEQMMVRVRSNVMHLFSPRDGKARLPEFSMIVDGVRHL